MSIGRVAVGHPVDVGSGVVFTKRRDFEIPGAIVLDWVRSYATDCAENGWLGRGWMLRFFMRLERQDDGFVFINEAGYPVHFPAAGGELDLGQNVRCIEASLELRRRANHFEILHWHVGTNEVERFCFELKNERRMALSWIENLSGQRILIEYDARGLPVRVIQDLERRVFELKYDGRDLLTEVHFIGERGRRLLVRYGYDGERRLTSSMNALGGRCTYAYDDHHRIVAEGNPLGSTFRFDYDQAGRCVHTSGNDSYLERRLEYFPERRLTRVTDSMGRKSQYFLNALGQVIQQISPKGATTTSEFDEYGRIVKVILPDGGIVSYEYDDSGNRKTVIDEMGGRSLLEHNNLHLLTKFTDPKGSSWEYHYDNRGRLLRFTNPSGAVLECARDAHGLVIESRRPGGLVCTRRYGPEFRWMEVSDQISLVLREEVDDLGRQVAVYDAKGLIRRVKHDELMRPIEITDAEGRISRLAYNANNDLIERVLPGNLRELWHYDRFGRLVGHENAVGLMRMEYDTEDHLLAVTNRSNERLSRAYDEDGRMISQRFFDGRTESYSYSAQGFRTGLTKSDGRAVDFGYDAAGCLLFRKSSDGLSEMFEYDETARLIAAENNHAKVEFERDELGRVRAEVQNGRRVEYDFDSENNRIARRLSGLEHATIAMRFDVRGRLTSLEDITGVCQELRWDTGDQLIERRLPTGLSERFAYDNVRRLTDRELSSPSTGRFLKQRYVYDERGNVISRNDSSSTRTKLSYDAIDRLTSVTRTGFGNESYRYTADGTILQTHRGSRTIAPGGRTVSDGVNHYEYGRDGCVSAVESATGRLELTHSVDGKLTHVTLPGGTTVQYCYDALGRRIAKTVEGKRTEFIWSSCDLAAELGENAASTTYFQYAQAPLAQWSNGRRQIPVVDQIGLPEALLDEWGTPLWQANYEAFGKLSGEIGNAFCPFRFRGQYHDRETNFYYNFHRNYEPTLAGYLAPDPIGLAGGANFYLYPRNPFLWDDPFGLTCTNKHKGQMGEAEMDAHFAAQGYTKIGSHDAPHGGGPGRPQGIDGVYHNPTGTPPYIIAEAKYGSAGLGNTVHSGQQMSDHWVSTPIGTSSTPRLEQAVGPAHAAAIQNSASTNPGSVQRQVFHLPDPGTPGTGSVTQTANYDPTSSTTTF